MKKFTLILATVALLAAGCSKTEVVGPQNRKGINFAAYTAKTTKAPQEDVTTENLSSFEVTAFGNGAIYFDNLTFKKSTESIESTESSESTEITVWKSDTKYFWPAFPLTFCAYNTPIVYKNPAHITGFKRRINTGTQELDVAPAKELAYQQDLVAAYAAGMTEINATSAGNTALPLTFNHYLTQVIVQAKNARSATYQVVVDGVKIANMAAEGTYTFWNNTMAAPEGAVNSGYSIDYKATFTAKTLTSDPKEVMTNNGNGKWYLIPQTVTPWNQAGDKKNNSFGTYLALKVKITANNGALKIYPATDDKSKGYISGWMAVPIPISFPNPANQFAFAQGKKYIFNINFFANNGAGYVDPEFPSELDGDRLTEDNGQKIIGGEIKFNADVTNWTDVTVNIDL